MYIRLRYLSKKSVIQQKSKVTHAMVFNMVRISADKNFLFRALNRKRSACLLTQMLISQYLKCFGKHGCRLELPTVELSSFATKLYACAYACTRCHLLVGGL